jgi:rubredoxin
MDIPFRADRCGSCGFICEEAKELLDEGIAAGARWEDITDGWNC